MKKDQHEKKSNYTDTRYKRGKNAQFSQSKPDQPDHYLPFSIKRLL